MILLPTVFLLLATTIAPWNNNGVIASSIRSPPLTSRAISHPERIGIEVLPRRSSASTLSKRNVPGSVPRGGGGGVQWDDQFFLAFNAHGENVTLSLRPSLHLIHPDGINSIETHTDLDGVRTTIESRLGREQFRAYEGVVLDEGVDRDEWRKGEMAGLVRDKNGQSKNGDNWARIVLLPDADSTEGEVDEEGEAKGLRFQGSYAKNDQVYSIHSSQYFLRTRRALDPYPPRILNKRSTIGGDDWQYSEMVVVREGDTLTREDERRELMKRGMDLPADSLHSEEEQIMCGHDDLEFNQQHSDSSDFSSLLMNPFGMMMSPLRRRDDISGGTGSSSNFAHDIGNTAGCPQGKRVVFVGVAADCTYVNHYSTADAARTQILTDFNSASSLYSSSFNISLGIVNLNVQSGACPKTAAQVDPANPWNVGCVEGGGPGLSINDRLDTFSTWRGNQVDNAGLYHLLTNCSSGSEVGIAWLGQLCKQSTIQSNNHSTSGTGVTAITTSTWTVIAHELGHNFGAIHDCSSACLGSAGSSACCPFSVGGANATCNADSNYIMSPVSVKPVTGFSPCSIGNICSALDASLNTSCLAIPGAVGNPSLISLQSCGNGILEAGEDCDPGTGVDDPCCVAATCKFTAGSVCSPVSSSCCTQSCQVAAKGIVCRTISDPKCDSGEMCSGNSSSCPANAYVADGTSCGSNGLACASGLCTSRTAQCVTVGSSLGITAACSTTAKDSCTIVCAAPDKSNNCVELDQSFRDGTPCGYAGVCENTVCRAGSPINVALSWYRANLQISIPITVGIAILVLLFIVAIYRCCTRRSIEKQNRKRALANASEQANNQAPPTAYVPAMVHYADRGRAPSSYYQVQQERPTQYQYPSASQHWNDQSRYGGPDVR